MRFSRAGIVLATVMAVVVVSGCASTPKYATGSEDYMSADREGRTEVAERDTAAPTHPNERMRQTNDKNNDWGDAISAPLEDFNLRRQDIPLILSKAVTKPYDLSGLDSCEAISSEVRQLDVLLGRDFDEPPPPKDTRSNSEKGKEFANNQAVDAVRGAARGMVPFRGAIRYLSGADKHQKSMDNAIQAGKVRRAYLKGIGMNKNCAPPAAPSWFAPKVLAETFVEAERPAVVPVSKKPAPKKRTSRKHR